jgi:hypothetical protein
MFTVQDLTVGDLVATMHLTVSKIQALPATIDGVRLFSVEGIDWNTNNTRITLVPANKEIEVWE